MKRRTLMILENAQKKRKDHEDEKIKKQQERNGENIAPNAPFVKKTLGCDVSTRMEPHSFNLFEEDQRTILSPINTLAEESETECNDSVVRHVLVRSSSGSSSSSSISNGSSTSSSSGSSSTSSSSSSSSSSAGTHAKNDSTNQQAINSEETLQHQNRLAKKIVSTYRVSPVNEYGSDPDLSDDDPTFEVDKNKKYQRFTSENSVNSQETIEPQLSLSVQSRYQLSSRSIHLQSHSSDEQEPQLLVQQEPGPSAAASYQLQSSDGNELQSSECDATSRSASSSDPEPQPSGSSVDESSGTKSKPRKRQCDPTKWKQNVVKSLRNTGQAYTSLSKSKKEVPARVMKAPCTCHMKCYEKIDEPNRKEIFDTFWQLGSVEFQRLFIRSCMTEIHPKYKYSNARNPRSPNYAYFFSVAGIKIKVCKIYFINTLDITDRMIRTVRKKTDCNGFLEAEQRGKHDNRKTTDEKDIQEIEAHINSIPRIPSHFIRANSDRDYITGGKTIKDLWRDFLAIREEQNKPELPYWLYHNIFTTKFNISFFQPKKDKCDSCLKFELSSAKEKELLQESHDMHLTEKTICRLEKKEDRSKINEENICVVYDLQAVMQCPTGETSSFYYVSKLNCLNFTIAELTKKTLEMNNNSEAEDLGAYGNVYSYFWDETQARRGSNEIGSCVYDYIQNLSEKSSDKTLDITFYSDNCAGQNKNKYITCLYAYAIANLPNIKSITHKFLITGHTQNEGDNVHSLIEKEIKKSLKSGPIYSPHEYISLIKSAKKNGVPFKVKELSYDSIFDLKALQKEWGYNYNEDDDDREQISWSDIKVLHFVKTEPFKFYYKTSYTQDNFRCVNMRNKRKKMPSVEEIVIEPEFQQKLKLPQNTIKGLKELLKKNLIPNYYVDYYNTIVSEN